MTGKLLVSALCLAAFSSCSGYQLGNAKPSHLSSVDTIAVPLFENQTQEPRLATLTTNSVVDSITRDGTYHIGNANSSDAELVAKITNIKYTERRSSRFDTLRSSELYAALHVKWSLTGENNRVLASGNVIGRSQFSLAENQQLSRSNALADASKNAAEKITQQLANGF